MSHKEHKKVSVGGLTKNGRLKDLEKKKTRMSGKGWSFVEYHDEGMSKSFAKFEKEIPERKPLNIILVLIVVGVLLLLFALSKVFSGGTSSESPKAVKSQESETSKPPTTTPRQEASGEEESAKIETPVSHGRPSKHAETAPADSSPDIPKTPTAVVPEEASIDFPYDADPCVTGIDCEEWYLIHDIKEVCVLIRSTKEPVPKAKAHVLSGKDSILADALEEEIFESRYSHLEDDQMLAEIAKAWDVPVEKLKEVNLARAVLQEYLKHGKFIDKRGPSTLPEENLSLSPRVLGGKLGRPRIVGSTNLPDGTQLMVSVHDKDSEFYTGQSKTTVRHGQFMAGPFMDRNHELAQGEYVADVTMPLPRVQSREVQLVIGSSGENVRGPLVEKDEIGVTAKASVTFFVGSSQKAAKKAHSKRKAATKKENRRLLREAQALEKKGRKMEPLRSSQDLGKLSECGEQMRENQAKARELRAAADKLPRSTRGSLFSAAINLNMCVSCMKDAMDYCDMVRQDLRRVEK